MKKNRVLWILFISCILSNNIVGQTISFSGDIVNSTTWDVDTVLVTGNVVVHDSITLTIYPGVIIEFQGDYSLKIEGRLLALGSSTDYIHFTNNDSTFFINNQWIGWEGIIFESINLNNDTSKLKYCIIEYSIGGGVYASSSNQILISNSIIRKNRNHYGGGLRIENSDITLINSEIYNNYIGFGGQGAGIFLQNSDALLENNQIFNNETGHDGTAGAIYCGNSNPLIINNNIHHNKAFFFPGIYLSISDAVIINTNISNNSGDTRDSGILSISSNFTLINSNICFNNDNTTENGSGIYLLESSPTIINSNIYYNRAFSDYTQVTLLDSLSVPEFYNCNIQGGISEFNLESGIAYTGNYINNIDENPMFLDTVNFNYHLHVNSPCINNGSIDTTDLNLPFNDLNNENRIVNDIIDIGPYEYQIPTSIRVYDRGEKYISVYPNPSNKILTIEGENTNLIEILDINGRIVMTINDKGSIKTIDISDLKQGIYFVKTASKVQKIIKL